eukprot:RCo050239
MLSRTLLRCALALPAQQLRPSARPLALPVGLLPRHLSTFASPCGLRKALPYGSRQGAPVMAAYPVRFIRVGQKKTETMTEERTTTQQEQDEALQARQGAGAAQGTQYQQTAPPKVDYSKEPTAGSLLEADVGMQRFVARVMQHTAGGLGITAATTAMCVTGILPMPMLNMATMLILGLTGIGCVFAAARMPPIHLRDAQGHLTTSNPTGRLALSGGFCVIQGFLFAPLIAMCPAPLVGAAGLVTAGVVAGMGAFALAKPSGSLLTWGGPLFAGLMGLIACGLGSMVFAGSAFGSGLFWISAVGGVGLFSAFLAFDIQSAIQEYRQGVADHLGHALNMYIDIINLFQKILLILRMFWDE